MFYLEARDTTIYRAHHSTRRTYTRKLLRKPKISQSPFVSHRLQTSTFSFSISVGKKVSLNGVQPSRNRHSAHQSTWTDRTIGFSNASYVAESYNNELECSPCYERKSWKSNSSSPELLLWHNSIFRLSFRKWKSVSLLVLHFIRDSCDRKWNVEKDPSWALFLDLSSRDV